MHWPCAYDSIIEVRDKAQLVTIGLHAQLLAAIDATFIMDLQHAQFGYARVTFPKFLAHLFDNYGRISQPALNKNQASLATAWNPEEPPSSHHQLSTRDPDSGPVMYLVWKHLHFYCVVCSEKLPMTLTVYKYY